MAYDIPGVGRVVLDSKICGAVSYNVKLESQYDGDAVVEYFFDHRGLTVVEDDNEVFVTNPKTDHSYDFGQIGKDVMDYEEECELSRLGDMANPVRGLSLDGLEEGHLPSSFIHALHWCVTGHPTRRTRCVAEGVTLRLSPEEPDILVIEAEEGTGFCDILAFTRAFVRKIRLFMADCES